MSNLENAQAFVVGAIGALAAQAAIRVVKRLVRAWKLFRERRRRCRNCLGPGAGAIIGHDGLCTPCRITNHMRLFHPDHPTFWKEPHA